MSLQKKKKKRTKNTKQKPLDTLGIWLHGPLPIKYCGEYILAPTPSMTIAYASNKVTKFNHSPPPPHHIFHLFTFAFGPYLHLHL